MAEGDRPAVHPSSKSQPELGGISDLSSKTLPGDSTYAGSALLAEGTGASAAPYATPTPGISRTPSFSASSYNEDISDTEDGSFFPPVERLTMFDFIENLALPQRVEKIQTSLQAQADRFKRQQSRLKSTGMNTRDRVVDEWRRRVPTPDEQLDKYRKRMRNSVDRLSEQWSQQSSVTAREKASFIAGVMNIFISGYLVGGRPEWFPAWYTVQLLYFMPIRFYTYHKKGYHYFLADLCYFVNLLAVLSIWVFPNSKRLFISTYCLAYGNNAIAIAMWRNSLVFHSMDKVVSLFIHIMPCVMLHCLVHLLPPETQQERYPAIYNIRYSDPDSPQHYGLLDMIIWATVPYLVWQLSYHFGITVRRREKIAAGRPTSFTWLRKSYASTWIGKIVLSLPDFLQEPAFMLIQYSYACLTMIPCPIWFWSRWASGGFLAAVFMWSIYNGATYYIDHYGKKFQKELEALKKDVAKWQNSPGGGLGPLTPGDVPNEHNKSAPEIDRIPQLDGSTGVQQAIDGEVRERK
ncbi:hypothetical protein K491DRAFT_696318 [Lophiostoma macrostomum CBS 122681]|uniref:Glycerophosphocholine acyltransferase 1 n=1 Tax=Lophiostoma macrostomum CBS 122681 TaxID=1314788 RepID=A0A6A6SYG8_9PLEO|nr:hypothetical protein K491DRAFT_696318 [Lophiostoma macrostomum CBS 122681]